MSRPSGVSRGLGLAALLLLAACDQGAGSGAGPAPEYRPGESGTVDHALCLLGFSAVPVREVDPGHHLIEATINGRSGQFVLDTGANLSVITASQAERFGLSSGDGGGLLAGRALPAGTSGPQWPDYPSGGSHRQLMHLRGGTTPFDRGSPSPVSAPAVSRCDRLGSASGQVSIHPRGQSDT
ncbi:aspartyl protease family protein [Brevundimonas sp. SL161]|uniref:aspartyl protease family protein n=1 Tax=Brevundimonas sp. SL161 TaxID=2804613 RepID=UPI003CEE588D